MPWGDDDWMNPKTSATWTEPRRKEGTVYEIQRKRRVPVTGNVAYIERWETWQEFDSKEKRDKELERLRKETSWHVRGRTAHYIFGQKRYRDPSEYMDF